MRPCTGSASLGARSTDAAGRTHTHARPDRRQACKSCVDAAVRSSAWPRVTARAGCGCSDRSRVARRGRTATSTCWSRSSSDGACSSRQVSEATWKSCCAARCTSRRHAGCAMRARARASRSNGKRGGFERAARPRPRQPLGHRDAGCSPTRQAARRHRTDRARAVRVCRRDIATPRRAVARHMGPPG
jgi:hypothetical protein